MTLQEWTAQATYAPQIFVPTNAQTGRPSGPPTGALCVPDVEPSPSRARLWSLSDYRVTAVTGGTIWLAPR